MTPAEVWLSYAGRVEQSILDDLKRRTESSSPTFLTVQDVRGESETPVEIIRALLDDLVAAGALEVRQHQRCPGCQQDLSAQAIEALRCSCGEVFVDDQLPQPVRVYVREGTPTRDVRWAITLHGMNTAGVWQQDFSWRLAQAFRYSIPVGLYKYGNVKFAPFLVLLRMRHRRRFVAYFKKVRKEMIAAGFGAVPDVIAHSFGTWLLSRVLASDDSEDPIRVGRVILTGSIVRPDFDWRDLIRRGRLEAVLCHVASRDLPARLAHWGIRGTGPSSVRGFNDRTCVQHAVSSAFGHSDYFTEANMEQVIQEVWVPFLTRTVGVVEGQRSAAGVPWAPSMMRYLTLGVTYFAVVAVGMLILLAICYVMMSVYQLVAG
jgi:hypothetical protein